MIIENPDIFRYWLATVLEPLCDADPAALAKYVYALVKKDKPVTDLRESMVDQLDVFLQQETKSFVALLFKTIENKEYLNVKKDTLKDEKKAEELRQTTQPAQSTEAEKEKEKEKPVVEEQEKDKDNDDHISSTDEKQNGVQIQSSVVSEGTVKITDSDAKLTEGKEERRKDSDRDDRVRLNRGTRLRRENSLPRNQRSRSRSWDRLRRSRSRERDRDRERGRERDRGRLYRNKSPPRRYERGFDRRSPSPGRYRAASRSKSRSPKVPHRGRYRNRSPPLSRSRSPRSKTRSRSRSYDRKNSPVRDDTPTQDSNHGDIDMRLSQSARSGNDHTRCRDYDEKGFCMKGDLCPYDHGTDPVVLEDFPQGLAFGAQGPPNLPMAPPGVPRAPIHDMVPPIGHIPGMPPPPGVGPMPMGLPHHMIMQAPPPLVMRPPPNMEYSPDAPGINPGMNWGRPAFRGPPRPMHPHPPVMGFQQGPRELISVPVESHSHSFHMQNPNTVKENHGHMEPRKTTFDSNRQFTNCCLALRKVPAGLNNITHLNNHFAKFGKIVNIQVNFENDPESAMITFSSPAEANAAIKSTEAVLNNRFIKVFWHNGNKDPTKVPGSNIKDRLGSGPQSSPPTSTSHTTTPPTNTSPFTTTSTSLKRSSAAVETLKKDKTVEDQKAKIAAIMKSQEMLEKNKMLREKKEEKRKEAIKITSDLRKRSQNLLEEQIEQQKSLIKKLELGNMDEKQKKNIKETIKLLQESIEKIKKELLLASKPVKKVVPVKKTKEEIQKEILDTELDLITKQQEGGDVSALLRKISLLKLELTRLQPKLIGPRTVPRGPLKTSLVKNVMSVNRTLTKKVNQFKSAVDHRPTKLLVSGYENDEKDMVLAHFRQFGEIGDYISDDSTPSIVLNFKTRQEAEAAMAKGKSFQDRLLTVTWFTNASIQSRRRNSSVSGPTYHMHAGRQVLLSGSETDPEQESAVENDESEADHGLESSEDLLLQDDDDELEDEERSWRR